MSTNALPALTAVTLMRCVVILWDLTHAHAKQDSQEMETPALVSRLSLTTVKMTAWSKRTDKRCQVVRLCKQ